MKVGLKSRFWFLEGFRSIEVKNPSKTSYKIFLEVKFGDFLEISFLLILEDSEGYSREPRIL